MRIGLLIYGNLQAVSGGYLYNRKMVEYLRNQGEQIEIISLPQGNYWQQLGHNFSQVCFRQIRAANIDILIQDAMVHPSLVLVNQQIIRQLKIPIISLVHLLNSFDHQPYYRAWLYRSVERQYFKTVTGIIANSQTTLAHLKTILKYRLPPNCIALPAGDHFDETTVNLDKLRNRILTSGPLRILVVGNVIRRKGLHVLIQALNHLPAESFQITVVGRLDMDPGYVNHIKQLIQSSLLPDRVMLMGAIQGQSLSALYHQHHVLVLPSAYESFGIVYLEAQQFGLPVIGTTGGAAKEIIRHGENGYLIHPEDSKGLAQLLNRLQQDRQQLLTLSQNALTAFSTHPKWHESIAIIHQFLQAHLKIA